MVCVQKTYRFLINCPICKKEYNEHWKIVNHIRKTKDDEHQLFLKRQEKEVVKFYVGNKKCRYHIKEELYDKRNIFAGIDYGKLMNIVNEYIQSDELERKRRSRISRTMKITPKTPEHNKKVSEGVKKAWKNGIFDTEENKKARERGYKKRKSFKGKNNPMYGKPSPKGAGRGKGGIRKDIGHYVRSTWEANICRVCQYMKREYKYEPDRFKIIIDGEDYTYCPDLYFPYKDFYYEIKGHAKSSKEWICTCSNCEKNRKKLKAARKEHGIKIMLIGHAEYKQFKRRFKKLLPNWEK